MMVCSRWLITLVLSMVVAASAFAGQSRITIAQEDGSTIESAIETGATGRVGDYEVTVTDVSLDATDEVLAADSFNVAPKAGDRYVLISMEVTNLALPNDDVSDYGLLFGMVGDAAVGYSSYFSPCGYVGDGEITVQELERGESEDIQVCWSISEDEVDSVMLYAVQILGEDEGPIWFSLGTRGPSFVVPEIADDIVSDNSRGDPVPVGESGLVGEFLFRVIAVEANATERITNINDYNADPEEGSQFFLVRAQIQFVGEDLGLPSWQLGFAAEGDSGREYTSYEESCNYVPDDDDEINDLFPGGEAEFNLCWMVERDDAETLTVQVTDVLDDEDSGVWFSLEDD